jgi:hypothetical protein
LPEEERAGRNGAANILALALLKGVLEMSERRLWEDLDTPHLKNATRANIIFQASKYTYNLHYIASAISKTIMKTIGQIRKNPS